MTKLFISRLKYCSFSNVNNLQIKHKPSVKKRTEHLIYFHSIYKTIQQHNIGTTIKNLPLCQSHKLNWLKFLALLKSKATNNWNGIERAGLVFPGTVDLMLLPIHPVLQLTGEFVFIILAQLTTFFNHNLLGSLPALWSESFQFLDNIHAFDDTSEDHMLVVQPASLDSCYEELASVGVGTRVGHGHDTCTSSYLTLVTNRIVSLSNNVRRL